MTLALAGAHVFPLLPNSKVPPKGMRFKELATRDEATIRAWWAQIPDANIGVYCGKWGDKGEALAVIDVDVKNGKDGREEIRRRKAEGQEFPNTYEVNTPTGGQHIYYIVPRPLNGDTDKLGKGCDLKSYGGYVLGEGSTIDGKAYSDAGKHDIIVPAPQWLPDEVGLASERKAAPAAPATAPPSPAAISRGARYLEKDAPPAIEGHGGDATAYKVGCRMKDFGLDEAAAFQLMAEHWNPRCSPPWDREELAAKVAHAYRYGFEQPGVADPARAFEPVSAQAAGEPVTTGFTTGSDIDIAFQFIAVLRNRYPGIIFSEGSFWWFEGKKFSAVPHNELRRILHDFDGKQLNSGRIKLGKAKIDSILHEAAVMADVPGFFDNAPAGIPCESGWITFGRDGAAAIVPHKPAHRNRHVLSGRWAPGASWQRPGSLLDRLCDGCFKDDADKSAKIALLGEVAGAAASGCSTHLVKPRAIVLYGITAENGKSQWLDALRGLLLSSAISALPPAKFSDEKYLVQLVSKLLNASDELSSAKAISGDSFKAVITGDPCMARDVYGQAVTFRPIALHTLATNTLPGFSGGMDKGVMRRLLVITFNRTVPESERIEHLGVRVAAEEADLLLAFAVEGATRLIARRFFAEPESSRTALRNWVCGADPVVAWFADRVDFEDGERLVKATAYQDFRVWARTEGFSERRLPAINNFVTRVLAQNNQIGEARNRQIGRYFTNIKLAEGGRTPFTAAEIDPFAEEGVQP